MSVTGDMTSDHESEQRAGLDAIRQAVSEELNARFEPALERLTALEKHAEKQAGPEAKKLREEIEKLRAELGTEKEQRTSAIMDTLDGPLQDRLAETTAALGQAKEVGADMASNAEKMNSEHAEQNRQKRKNVRARTFLAMLAVAVLMGWGPALIEGLHNWWTGRTEIELTSKEQETRAQNAQDAAALNRIQAAYRALEADEREVFRGMLNEAERRIEKQTGRSYRSSIIPDPKAGSSNQTSSGK